MSKKKIAPQQKEPLMKIIGEVIDELPSYGDSFQKLIEIPNLKKKLRLMLLEEIRPFLWEGSGYPSRHRRSPIVKQLEALAEVFGVSTEKALNYYNEVASKKKLPLSADGYFAIPRVDAVARKHFPEITDSVQQYKAAAVFILKALKMLRPTDNYYHTGYVEKHEFDIQPAWLDISNNHFSDQKGDVVIIPAQLGRRWFGNTTLDAVLENMATSKSEKQFPLGLYEAACLLLTHPYRLSPNAALPLVCTDGGMKRFGTDLEYAIFGTEAESESYPDRVWFNYQVKGYQELRGFITGFLC